MYLRSGEERAEVSGLDRLGKGLQQGGRVLVTGRTQRTRVPSAERFRAVGAQVVVTGRDVDLGR